MILTCRPAGGVWAVALLGGVLIGCGPSTPKASPDPPGAAHIEEPDRADGSSTSVPREARAGDWFEDVTAASGIEFVYQTGRSANRLTILETVGGGVGVVDYDLDSRADIYAVGGGTIDAADSTPHGAPGKLFRQVSDWRFADVTTAAGLTHDTDYSHGILAGDLDNDGFPDLFLTCYGVCRLWRNMGDGTFEAATEESEVGVAGWHTAAACADLNADGHLDVLVTNYVDWSPSIPSESGDAESASPRDVPPPQQFAPLPDRLFLNRGDGRFQEVGAEAGIRTDGMGLGVVAADLNDDGRADVYVANDVVGNHLYWGGMQFPLQETGELSGAAYNESGTPEGSMGVDAEDVDGDGRPDLWVTNFELEDNSLYLNLGDGQFRHATARFGLAGVGRALVGFGTGFQDFDGDGWPDLYVLNGHVRYHSPRSPFRQAAFLLRNVNGRRFEDVTEHAGSWFSIPHAARGAAASDLNGDGAIDLVVSSLDERLSVLRNRLAVAPSMRLRLVGTRSPRDPVGATVAVEAAGRQIVRLVKSGAGYLSQSDSRITVPLDVSGEFVEIRVMWPSQVRELFRERAIAGDHLLVEGRGATIH